MVRAFLCLDSYFLLVCLHGGSPVLYCLFGLFFVLVWGFGLCILRLLGGILCFLVTHEPFFSFSSSHPCL